MLMYSNHLAAPVGDDSCVHGTPASAENQYFFLQYLATRDLSVLWNTSGQNADLKERLDEIRSLEDGWHGTASKSISRAVLERVEEVVQRANLAGLPVPEITPTSQGTVSLEWEQHDRAVYLEIGQTRANGFIQFETGFVATLPDTEEFSLPALSSIRNMLDSSAAWQSTSVTQAVEPYRSYENMI